MERVERFLKRYDLWDLKHIFNMSKGVCRCEECKKYFLLDFDLIKVKLSKQLHQKERRSCDGMFIEKGEIYLVEFKSIRSIFENYYRSKRDGENFKKFLAKLRDNPFEQKIEGTLFFLNYILYHKEVDSVKKYQTIYYIVSDISELSPRERLSGSLNLLASSKREHCLPLEALGKVSDELENVIMKTTEKMVCMDIEVKHFKKCNKYLETDKYFKEE